MMMAPCCAPLQMCLKLEWGDWEAMQAQVAKEEQLMPHREPRH
jgi:hypothetical protein